MKFLAFILAHLVLALSVMPCADMGVAANNGKVKSELVKSSQQKADTQEDDCSPFCHCTCCAGFSINHSVPSLVIMASYGIGTKTAYLPVNVLDVALPIWQPPRLV